MKEGSGKRKEIVKRKSKKHSKEGEIRGRGKGNECNERELGVSGISKRQI